MPRDDSVPAIPLMVLRFARLKGYSPADWREARLLRLPGTERALCRDLSSRGWICQCRFERRAATITETMHHEIVTLEHSGQFALVARNDLQPGRP